MHKLKIFIVSIVISSCYFMTYAQNSVTGNVSDMNGEAVIGASILEKGTTNGTITDIDGNFTLNVSEGTTLQISYIGYVTQEITVTGQSLRIILDEDTQTLDEVVVVGFGTQKKVNLTGAVGLATSKDIEARPVNTLSDALQGIIPGLQLTHNAGDIETNMSIRVRGTGTIGEGSSDSPLVLIDGMEGDINLLNPQDVESISVLKDASASSIYGSRAAFGVVLITTKKGSEGKTTINYNNSFRLSSPIGMPEMMDSYTFANYFNQGALNAGWGAIFTNETMQNMLDFQAAGGTNTGGLLTDGNVWGKPAGDPFTTAYANTDWYKELYRNNAFSQNHNLSISGGTEKLNYYASLGYLNYNGMLRHGSDGQERYNASGKINARLADWVTFDYSMRLIRQDLYRPNRFGGGFYEMIGRQTWPNLPVYDENGYYHNSNADTPAMMLSQGGVRQAQTDRIYQQAAFILEPIKNWRTHVEFNYSIFNQDVRQTNLPYYNHDVQGNIIDTQGTSSLHQSYKKENYMNWNIYSDYSWTMDDSHNFKTMLGFQADELKQSYFSATGYGLQAEELPELDLIAGVDGQGVDREAEISGYRNQWATAGFFGRINYDYEGRYLAEVNLRYDGSSRFRRGTRWTWSPSFSLGWNIAQEEFWEGMVDVVNHLKLRGSYGVLGNQNTNVWYPTYRTITINQQNGSWLQSGTRPNTSWVNDLVSTSLTWETVRTWNIGLDWGLFNNRLTGSFDTFIRFTDDMVGPAMELPASLGLSAPKSNNSDLKTIGNEITLTWRDRISRDFNYGITVNVHDAKTYIRNYPGNTTRSIWNYNEGRRAGEIWGYETVGIAKTQEQMDAHLEAVGGQNALGSEWSAGDIMYADQDGKPGINAGAETLDDHGDLKVIGNTTPRYFFGIDLTANFKGFDFRAFLQGVAKRDFYTGSPIFWGVTNNQWWSAALGPHQDYFRANDIGLDGNLIPANTNSYFPRPVFGTSKNQQTQSRYLQDASYIRLKNVQLGYTLPADITQKAGISNCRLFVSVDNLWTGTNLLKVFDPETIDGGYEKYGNAYPLARTFSFGISTTF
jgi:TonB-linked SusC/RagA family outer membrane protein